MYAAARTRASARSSSWRREPRGRRPARLWRRRPQARSRRTGGRCPLRRRRSVRVSGLPRPQQQHWMACPLTVPGGHVQSYLLNNPWYPRAAMTEAALVVRPQTVAPGCYSPTSEAMQTRMRACREEQHLRWLHRMAACSSPRSLDSAAERCRVDSAKWARDRGDIESQAFSSSAASVLPGGTAGRRL